MNKRKDDKPVIHAFPHFAFYFDSFSYGDCKDFTISAYLHPPPPFKRAPVLIVIRVSYVWQTPRAKSPSKRQLEGNHGGSKPLMRDTCHVLKCAGDESGKEVTDFFAWTVLFFFFCFFLSQPSSLELIMGHRKWQVRDSLGVWASVCPLLSQGSWVPNERLPVLAEHLFNAPSPKIINKGLVNSILEIWWCSCEKVIYYEHYMAS